MAGESRQVIDASGRRVGWRRPVAIPADVAQRRSSTASGLVELPLHVYWSDPPRRWDLADRQQLGRVYELVLTEGTEDDVRRFIAVDELLELWPSLVLPLHVREAWREFLNRSCGARLVC